MTGPDKSSHGQMRKHEMTASVHQEEPVREALVTKLQPTRTGCSVVKAITTLS